MSRQYIHLTVDWADRPLEKWDVEELIDRTHKWFQDMDMEVVDFDLDGDRA